MTTLSIEDYLKVMDLPATKLAYDLGVSPQRVHHWRSITKAKVYIDYDVEEGEVQKVFSYRDIWSKSDG
jgi:hypothetical protein